MARVSISQMLDAGVHFGHQTRLWNPKMLKYIHSSKSKIHIINLEKTLEKIEEFLAFVEKLSENNGKILFVGTKPAASNVIKEEAIKCGMPYVDYRWLGGMLTNYNTIKNSIKKLQDLGKRIESEYSEKNLTKKELQNMVKSRDKLSLCLGGIQYMDSLPDAIFVIDVNYEKTAVLEAKRLGITIAAVVDSDSSPEGIDFVIPGNDDAMRAIKLYCSLLADTINESKK